MAHDPAASMPFSHWMGVTVSTATAEEVVGHLEVREDLCSLADTLHGGAIMAFADALGGIGGFYSLPEGAKGTTTIESKTNFLGAASVGSKLVATSRPVKVGSRLSVWQTDIRHEDGRPVALVTQTQLVLR